MRDKMPRVSAFVDELREVFGRGEMNAVIREGLKADCEVHDRFFASEGGEQLGQRWVPVVEVSPALPVVLSAPVPKRGRR